MVDGQDRRERRRNRQAGLWLLPSGHMTNNQSTLSYTEDDGDRYLVNGDTAISKLGPADIGAVMGITSFITINIVPVDPKGYAKALPESAKLDFGNEQTARLEGMIDFHGLCQNLQIQRNVQNSAYQTIVPATVYPSKTYATLINGVYAPLRDKMVEIDMTAIIANANCAALLTNVRGCTDKAADLSHIPEGKLSHAMARLRDESVSIKYVGELVRRVSNAYPFSLKLGETYIRLPRPIKFVGRIEFVFKNGSEAMEL
ncbi:hypothetical protein N7532_000180 [Penicillium argentinense]|uniref:Uncharacterized protein n=1 Tax=Penicillium argentinense TaxID=1131581 RepID=A0A9W9G4R8_9EURO|nr:uncharacterized protein N7532_000180 [Penicillium argentinense]KAJ5112135.1 hypothetical protein N7532_000180 [Penicillium argentinense]